MRSLRAPILQQWLADRDLQELAEGEVHAIIDALALTMMADYEVGAAEYDEFASLMLVLPGTEQQHEDYLPTAVEKAALVESPAELAAFAAEVANRLAPDIHEKLFSMFVTLMVADREISPDEEVVLRAFADAFQLPSDRTNVIFHKTLERLGLDAD